MRMPTYVLELMIIISTINTNHVSKILFDVKIYHSDLGILTGYLNDYIADIKSALG